jgi:hypothetical protein
MSCMAGIGKPKLGLMLNEHATFVRSSINVAVVSRYLKETENNVPGSVNHPARSVMNSSEPAELPEI